ncbi:MAG: monofunctional biosynthetic peptidoglycan transglycosylase [Aestuariivita sp.]|nr:monofunctional biosynthetic peptidoglycan transglycosylase [Aestuariivita sp.]MCY4202458.1 monofunctional biosynthetic peptidoglycan transglycosylase [Aestuariivita sp.]
MKSRKKRSPTQAKRRKQKPSSKSTSWPSKRSFVLIKKGIVLGVVGLTVLVLVLILSLRVLNPPKWYYIWSEERRLGTVAQTWVPLEDISAVAIRAVVAAEDANFCAHWGIDATAVRKAISEGGARGASTISQQTVKNVFLWPDRSWFRKALEAVLTLVVEAAWPKRRIIEVYMNVAEFDEGVFGIEAAARHHFGVAAQQLTPTQAGRLAVVLPAPKSRSAISPSPRLQRLAVSVLDGAATIRADGRSACFEQ